MPASKTLPAYQAEVKKEIAKLKGGSGKVKVVMGNEAGDIDSMGCAVVLAYFYAEVDGDFTFPVINVPRDEMHLRKDNVEIFKVAGVSLDDLIFIDEIDLEGLAKAGRLELTIVDHNELSPRQDFLTASVVAIVDHHRDALLYKDTVKDERRFCLFPRASAASLSTEKMSETEKGKGCLEDPGVSCLLRTTIMLDTDNLKNADKTTDLDRDALKKCRDAVPAKKAYGDYSPAEWHKRVAGLRKNIDGFSAGDVMKKDLKFGAIGNEKFAIASGGVKLKELGALDSKETLTAFASEQKKFIEANKLHSVFALFKTAEDANKNKLVTVASSVAEWKLIKKSFTDAVCSDTEYGGIALKGKQVPWGVDGVDDDFTHDGFVYTIFEFNGAASRKQVLPAIGDFFKGHPRVNADHEIRPKHHHDDDEDHIKTRVKDEIRLKKPKFGKVKGIKPDSKGVNVLVKVVKCTDLEDDRAGKAAEAVCGDDTGSITLRLRGADIELAKAGASLRCQNAHVRMEKGFVRLVVDKWAKLAPAAEPLDCEVNSKNDLSATEYEYK